MDKVENGEDISTLNVTPIMSSMMDQQETNLANLTKNFPKILKEKYVLKQTKYDTV